MCGECFLVQLGEFATPEDIFEEYVYFSSYSDSWVAHAKRYAEQMVERFDVDGGSSVVEIASNDGYLLQWFKELGVPVLGVEPAQNVAVVAEEKGIPTVVRFFGRETAEELVRDGHRGDLVVANNVLAHVPDLNDFVDGIQVLLARDGVATLEFPHLLRLIEETEFDTIYHEHFSYFSLLTVERVFAAHGLQIFDVEELPTHGGSLRIYARHLGGEEPGAAVVELRERERAAGPRGPRRPTRGFADARRGGAGASLREFLETAQAEGRSVVAYGAAAKGVTLLNYCGRRAGPRRVRRRQEPAQARAVPPRACGFRSARRSTLPRRKPDYLLLLAWNLKDEIVEQMAHVREWGCRFVTPVPQVAVHD